MRNRPDLVILFATVVCLASCSPQRTAMIVQQPAIVVLKSPPPPPYVSPVRKKVLALLEKKNYRQAVELLNGRNHEGLEKEYSQVMNGLLEVGEDAFALGDYAGAARAFKLALSAYPAEASVRERVSRDPKQIRYSIDACANRMMEQGLEEYRRGRLENAAKKWKELLRISPAHIEARKALETTTAQLQSLQGLKDR